MTALQMKVGNIPGAEYKTDAYINCSNLTNSMRGKIAKIFSDGIVSGGYSSKAIYIAALIGSREGNSTGAYLQWSVNYNYLEIRLISPLSKVARCDSFLAEKLRVHLEALGDAFMLAGSKQVIVLGNEVHNQSVVGRRQQGSHSVFGARLYGRDHGQLELPSMYQTFAKWVKPIMQEYNTEYAPDLAALAQRIRDGESFPVDVIYI